MKEDPLAKSLSSEQSLPLFYYPFTVITPSLLEALAPCFPRVVLYRPVGADFAPTGTRRWLDNGFLEMRTPFEHVLDKEAIKAELQQWRSWGLLHRNGGVAYLKAVAEGMAPPDPSIPKLVSQLKAALHEATPAPDNRGQVIQLFLHLAEDLDRSSSELAEDLARFHRQHEALHEFFRTDDTQEEEVYMSHRLPAWSREDLGSIMTASRMTAWNHLFQEDHDESILLFTDSPAAQAWLLEAVEETVEILELPLSCHRPLTSKLSKMRSLAKLFKEIVISPWSDKLQKRVEEEGSRLQEMSDKGNQASREQGQKNASIRWSIVPNQRPCGLLNRGCGRQTECDRPSTARNTLVGLFESAA